MKASASNLTSRTITSMASILAFGGATIRITSAQGLADDRPSVRGKLTLNDAVATAIHDNLMLQAARAEVNAAVTSTQIARSQMRLQLSASSYFAYGDSNNILGSAGTVTPTNLLLAQTQGFADQNLTLAAPIYTGGRLEHMVQAAKDREHAEVSTSAGVCADITLTTKINYYRALLAAENVKAAQARMSAASEFLRTTQALADAGKGLEASVRRVEAEVAESARALTTAQNDQAKAMLDLKAAMGVRLDSDIALSDALEFAPAPGDLKSQLATASLLRPELNSARFAVSASVHQTISTRGSQGPQIFGMAMADGFAAHSPGPREGYTIGLVVSIPLLDGGQRHYETQQAEAQQARAVAEQRDTELRVANEVQQAWLDLQSSVQNYRTAQVALVSAQAAYDVTAVRVSNQKALIVEQLDALAALTLARANVSLALYEHSLAAAQLERATGSDAVPAVLNRK